MDLRRCEVEPFLHPHALHAAVGRRQTGGGFLVGEVLNDHRAFCDALAVVEFKNRNLAFAVDAPIVHAGLGRLLLVVDLFQVEIVAGLARHDMRRQRTGAGGRNRASSEHSLVLPDIPRMNPGTAWTISSRRGSPKVAGGCAAPPVPTQNSECRRNSRISSTFGVLSRDKPQTNILTARDEVLGTHRALPRTRPTNASSPPTCWR